MDKIRIPTNYRHPQRRAPLTIVVIHTTGETDEEAIVRYYSKNDKGIGPHYFIPYDGRVIHLVEEDRAAFHCGYTGDGKDNQRALYEQGMDVWTKRINEAPWILSEPFVGYETWKRRWPGRQSPLELLCGHSPNHSSIGIEVQEPEHRQPEKFFDAQYTALAELLKDISARQGIVLDRDHVLGHYDVNPIVRCGKDGDRDPGEKFNWDRLLQLCA